MAKDPRIWIAGIALCVAAWLILPHVRAGGPPPSGVAPEIDYVCRETRETFRLPAAEGPQVNPRTGRVTLVPARFDARTKSWQPGPPPGVRQRMPAAR